MRRRGQDEWDTGDEEQRHGRNKRAPEGEVSDGDEGMRTIADDANGGVGGGGAEYTQYCHPDCRQMLCWSWSGGFVWRGGWLGCGAGGGEEVGWSCYEDDANEGD